MPILNSVVESTEVFNRKRKNRLKTYQANNSENDEPPHEVGQWKVDPLVSAPKDRSSDSTTLEDAAGMASVEQDQPAGLPNRAVQADEAQEPEAAPQLTAEEGPKQEVERRSAPKRQQKRSAEASAKPPQASDQMYLKMNVAYPAAGVSPTYDHLADLHGAKTAFRLVLGKALDLYAAAALDGTASDAPASYTASPTSPWTTRVFPKAAYAALAQEMDRTGLASERALGTAIGRRALAAFVAADKESI